MPLQCNSTSGTPHQRCSNQICEHIQEYGADCEMCGAITSSIALQEKQTRGLYSWNGKALSYYRPDPVLFKDTYNWILGEDNGYN